MKTVGIVGWRGMVGSVLLERMRAEGDFKLIEPRFFSTSQAGELGPDVGAGAQPLLDANDPAAFAGLDMVISCQGGAYTKAMHSKLRASGYDGYWIDAASTLRLSDNAVIVLDPVNRHRIDEALAAGVRDYIGGNCTVSLMLMAIHALFEREWVEWINVATYQAASGAGAQNMRELVEQMRTYSGAAAAELDDSASNILAIDRKVQDAMRADGGPIAAWGAPLAASLIPWCGAAFQAGQTDEERKGENETNKILGLDPRVHVDGCCVRVGAMRSHSQSLTIKLKKDIPLADIEQAISASNAWVDLVPNEHQSTLKRLSPAAVSGTLRVAIGRLRKLSLGPEYLSAFTVGDQLLWGAAEPLRRTMRIILDAKQ